MRDTKSAAEATAAERAFLAATLLTLEATAVRLSSSRASVERLVRRGELLRVKLGPRSVRIDEASLLDLIERRRSAR
jgi:excisionase family DNA binding protein